VSSIQKSPNLRGKAKHRTVSKRQTMTDACKTVVDRELWRPLATGAAAEDEHVAVDDDGDVEGPRAGARLHVRAAAGALRCVP
jgi:hypothetical protein